MTPNVYADAMAKTHNNSISRDEPMLVSVIVPVCNQADRIEPLLKDIAEALGDQDYEVILVDDGSTDATAEAIETAAEQDSRICGLKLARSFGHNGAGRAGLRYAAGEVAILVDGPLPPELLARLIAEWRAGHHVVQARRTATNAGLKRYCPLKRLQRRLSTYVTGTERDAQTTDTLLLDRQVADEINRLRSGRWVLSDWVAWMGYRRTEVLFDAIASKDQTDAGRRQKQNDLAVPGLSMAPLRLGMCAGVGLAGLSLVYLLCLLVWMLLAGQWIVPWALGLAIVTLAVGVGLLLLSLQGAYLAHLCRRSEPSPAFLIERILGQPRRLQAAPDTQAPNEPDSPPPLRIFT